MYRFVVIFLSLVISHGGALNVLAASPNKDLVSFKGSRALRAGGPLLTVISFIAFQGGALEY